MRHDNAFCNDGNVIETDFDRRCDLLRKTSISLDMSYDERLRMQRLRYGL